MISSAAHWLMALLKRICRTRSRLAHRRGTVKEASVLGAAGASVVAADDMPAALFSSMYCSCSAAVPRPFPIPAGPDCARRGRLRPRMAAVPALPQACDADLAPQHLLLAPDTALKLVSGVCHHLPRPRCEKSSSISHKSASHARGVRSGAEEVELRLGG